MRNAQSRASGTEDFEAGTEKRTCTLSGKSGKEAEQKDRVEDDEEKDEKNAFFLRWRPF